MMNLHRARQIAAEAVEGGADWIEAGTPLIKSEGVECLRTLKKQFPDRTLVADLKTMDTGAYEVEIASKAGADVVTIMAVADDATMAEAVKAARRYGSKIMADLMRCEDKVARAAEVEALGAHYLCVHVSIDEQMVAKSSLETLRAVAKVANVPVAVAGGLNSETVAEALEAGASIIIVGGAIIKAPQVADAARGVKKAMEEGVAVATDLYKKYGESEVEEALRKVSTPNVADAMQKRGVMRGIVPRVNRGAKMVGRALTVKTADGDWAKPVEAIDRAAPGTVIVIDVGGGRVAVWGELASHSCKVKGVAGVVVDGAVRDIDTILDIDFPCFSRHVVPHAGEPKGHGEIGAEIECGGQRVRTGDWIVGDESGVVVIPQEKAVEMANRALDVLERENRLREEIKRGGTLSSVLDLEKWEKVG
jgi:3-hexulose-6-phosphate synthase/6-phospho-3-hexuloisomerase